MRQTDIEKIMEPSMTKQPGLMPAGLPLDFLSRPIRKPARNDKPIPTKKSELLSPVKRTSPKQYAKKYGYN